MKTLSAAGIRALEKKCVSAGIAEDVMMEEAGRVCAEDILNTFLCENKDNKKIIVLCGAGNNGGDGLVCARYLIEHGAEIYCCIMPSEKYSPLVEKNLKRAFFTHLSVKEITDLKELEKSLANASLVIDALLGIGFSGELKENYRKVTALLNSLNKKVISLDIPSGLNADTAEADKDAVRAELTCTFGAVKNGMVNREKYTGKIKVFDIFTALLENTQKRSCAPSAAHPRKK